MEEASTPSKLMDERLGHEDGSVQARYSHVTPGMRRGLTTSLTQLWEASLAARAAISPHSPVSILDELLTARANPRATAHDGDRPRFLPGRDVNALRAGLHVAENRP